EPGQASLVVLFASTDYDLDELGRAIGASFEGVPTVACTTAGEIGPHGYTPEGLTGFALPRDEFTVEVACIDDLQQFEYQNGGAIATKLRSRLENRAPGARGDNTFAFMIVDGLSRMEEPLTAAVHLSLGDIQLFGGSAGDGGTFERTHVYWNGEFRTDRALLTLIRTSRPFLVFRTQHFVASDKRMVVTESDPAQRVVYAIDGEPATKAYARHLGIPVEELDAEIFACHPVVVKMGGEYFVRSIMRHRPDGAIEFACAIDQGVVLRLAEGVDLVKNLEQTLGSVRQKLGPPELIVGCDCFFRFVEAQTRDIQGEVGRIMRDHNVVGFVTYGEQFNAAHVNQTLTGVAIGARRAA
ncbi:MAG: FIST C-terminal domain-containing protein, partial [Candidatus Eisenbacteria bacterium]|nr:FIST C-terminal domain-containing protein [Candidatus Eisenbacteria bacterium]